MNNFWNQFWYTFFAVGVGLAGGWYWREFYEACKRFYR